MDLCARLVGQLLFVRVTSVRRGSRPFVVRVNSRDWEAIKDRLSRPVSMECGLSIRLSLK